MQIILPSDQKKRATRHSIENGGLLDVMMSVSWLEDSAHDGELQHGIGFHLLANVDAILEIGAQSGSLLVQVLTLVVVVQFGLAPEHGTHLELTSNALARHAATNTKT